MKHFTYGEFFKSDKAAELKIDNTTKDETILKNIENLVDGLLDPLRDEFGNPITVNSGYRCPKLNKAVKGSSTSDHVKGQAADLIVKSGSKGLKILAGIVLRSNWVFDQMIWENGGAWLHLSLRRTGINRRQVLTAKVTGKGSSYAKATDEFKQSCIALANKECPKKTITVAEVKQKLT